MNNEPRCNRFGEMPGREGEGSYDQHYMDFCESNTDEILEAYAEYIVEQGDLEAVPDEFIQTKYEQWREDR